MSVVALALVAACGGRGETTGDDAAGPGFSDTEIVLGSACAASGNLASFQTTCAAEQAYFNYVNEELGGVKMADGKTRKIKFVWYDDAYSPPRTLEQVKRLVEQDRVATVFGLLGTGTSLAARDYLNRQEVPQLFMASGASILGTDSEKYPWTIGYQVPYATEASIYGQFIKEKSPNGTVAVLYQNDDFGKELLEGFKKSIEGSGVKVVAEESYAATAATVDSQVTTLAASRAEYFMVFAIPKFAIQSLRKVHELGWRTAPVLNSIAASVKGVIEPAGPQTAAGSYTASYVMDPTSPAFVDSDDVKFYRDIAKRFGPSNLVVDDAQSVQGFVLAQFMVGALEQTKEPTRAGLMAAARQLTGIQPKGLIAGIPVATSTADPFPLESMQMQIFQDGVWQLVGKPITSFEGATPRLK
ncbi:ABC transporter substrate-binding protein [Micromonospora sonneratiae]|uniref:ABC transporter substrate-binding protein n=1 Tax=Micromonospora sonneratiae TaxID=1184706 RepID=A0ABW3Y9P4_9ACTN